MPQRIQRKRTKGWRMPPGAVYVGRPSYWGNPYVLGREGKAGAARWDHWAVFDYSQPYEPLIALHDTEQAARAQAVDLFRTWHVDRLDGARIAAELADRDLACWCPLDQPCHADVLLDLANGGAA